MLTNYLKRYPLSLLLAVAIAVLSLIRIPEVKLMEHVSLADKWAHMLMYGGLALTVWFEYARRHVRPDARRLAVGAFLLPVAMGGVLELMQAHLTTCRSGDWLDFVANTLGALLGTLVGLAAWRFIPKKTN